MINGIVGTCALALRETALPDIKQVRSALMGTVLRIGDTDTLVDEAIELSIKTSKCTSLARPKGWKKFGLRESNATDMDEGDDDEQASARAAYAQLKMRSEYYVNPNAGGDDEDGDVKMKKEDDDEDLLEKADDEDEDEDDDEPNIEGLEKVEKEDLVRGFKYGTTYAPCPDGQFPKLPTRKGIDICGFFPMANVWSHLVFIVCFTDVCSASTRIGNG